MPTRLRIVVQRKRNEDDEDSVSAAAVGGDGGQQLCTCRPLPAGCRRRLDVRPGLRTPSPGYAPPPPPLYTLSHLPPLLPAIHPPLQEEMYSFVTLADDQNTKKGVVVLEA